MSMGIGSEQSPERRLTSTVSHTYSFNSLFQASSFCPHISTKVAKQFDVSHCFSPNRFPLLRPISILTRFVLTTTDPASTEKIGSCPEMSREDVAAAIDHAAVAFKKFKLMSGRERARLLRRWYDLMVENASDITTLLTWENGKPTPDAKREAYFAADFLEWFSEEAPRMYGDHIPTSIAGNRVITIRQPIGVCGLITPWNFPAAMITRKAGPAIAAGCTVVVKAPGETPFTSLALAELSRRAGIPDGVFNVVTCLDNTPSVGQELCENPVVKKISFTGSTAVGRLLMQQCAPTLKKLSFELGGNAPFIIFDDADIEKAVDGAISSKFRCCGQTCICANRIYVQKGIYQQFAESFAKKVREFKVGSGYEEGVTHGPLIHGRAVDKVHEHVEDARAKGATVIVGGKRDEHLGPNFYGLTVITGMHKDMKLHQEETFGPVAGLFEFDTEQNVIELANSSEVGLAAYFYSRDVNRIWRVAEALEVGMVGINAPLVSDVVSP